MSAGLREVEDARARLRGGVREEGEDSDIWSEAEGYFQETG